MGQTPSKKTRSRKDSSSAIDDSNSLTPVRSTQTTSSAHTGSSDVERPASAGAPLGLSSSRVSGTPSTGDQHDDAASARSAGAASDTPVSPGDRSSARDFDPTRQDGGGDGASSSQASIPVR